MSLPAGKLRHRVNIESVSYTQDATTGAMTPTWEVTHSHIPCSIEALSVKDFLSAKAAQSEVTARITLRYRSGLTDTMRLVGVCSCHEGKIYNPAGWLEDPETGREYLTAPCSQGVNAG